jgi:hypothetical protein
MNARSSVRIRKKIKINAKKNRGPGPTSPPTMDQPEKKKTAAEALKTPTTRLKAQQNPGEWKPNPTNRPPSHQPHLQ